MGDYIAIAFVAIILIAAFVYIIRAKKKGVKCIGCPSGGKCKANKNNSSCCCCNCDAQNSFEDNIK